MYLILWNKSNRVQYNCLPSSCGHNHCIHYFCLFYPLYFYLSTKKSRYMCTCILLIIVNFSGTSLVDPHCPTSPALKRVSWCFQSMSHFFQTWQAVKQSRHNIFLMKWYYHTDKYPDDTGSTTWKTIYKSKQVSLRFFYESENVFL